MAATSDDEPEEHSPRDVSAPHGGYPARISDRNGYPTLFGNYLYLPDGTSAAICIYQIALSPLSGLPRMAFSPSDPSLPLSGLRGAQGL
jgi:hypothetical protein